jgi:hypothetical protein
MPDPLDEALDEWWLTAQVQSLVPGQSATFDFVRQITGDELHQAREANKLLTRLANAAPYAKLSTLFKPLQETFEDKDKSDARKVIDMNRAAHALSSAAKELTNRLRSPALEDFGADSEELRQLDLAIAEESAAPTFQILISVADIQQGPFDSNDKGITLHSAFVEAVTQTGANISQQVQLIPTLCKGIMVAQRLIGRQLGIYRARVQAASLFLRRLAAEIPDGAPGLIRTKGWTKDAKLAGTGPLGMEPLALGSAVHIHRAIRLSDNLLARTTSARAANFDNADGNSTGDQPPGQTAKTRPSIVNPGPITADTSPHDQAVDKEAAVIDVTQLAAHATDFANSLEKAWSNALSPSALQAMQTDMNARFDSLLMSIQRQVSITDHELREAKVDTKLGSFPVSIEEIGNLSLEPDAKTHSRQTLMAQVDALAHVITALKAMRAPSARKIDLRTGVHETWWESGAFEMLRDRALLLARISDHSKLAAAAVAGDGEREKISYRLPYDTLRAAGKALSHGDVFGAVINARLSIMQRARLTTSDVPTDFIQCLAANPQLNRESEILNLMEQTAQKIQLGEHVDIGVATLLAPHAIAIAQQLYMTGAEVIRLTLDAKQDSSSTDRIPPSDQEDTTPSTSREGAHADE